MSQPGSPIGEGSAHASGSCKRAAQSLDALVYGELTGDAAAAVRGHLRGCERCQREHARLALERRLFAGRAASVRAATQGEVPSFDAVLARAATATPPLGARIHAAYARLSHAAFAQAVVGGAMALVSVGLLRQPAPPAVDESVAAAPRSSAGRASAGRVGPASELVALGGRAEGCAPVANDVGPTCEPAPLELSVCAQSIPDECAEGAGRSFRDIPRKVEYESRVDPLLSLDCSEENMGMSIPEPCEG